MIASCKGDLPVSVAKLSQLYVQASGIPDAMTGALADPIEEGSGCRQCYAITWRGDPAQQSVMADCRTPDGRGAVVVSRLTRSGTY